jgi:hypothetical protein
MVSLLENDTENHKSAQHKMICFLPISPNIQVKAQQQYNAYRMINIEETFACWEFVIRINSFQSSNCKKHSNGRSKGKEYFWFIVETGVSYRHLEEGNKSIFH